MNRTHMAFLVGIFLILGMRAIAQEEVVATGPVGIQDLLMLPGWFGEDYRTYQPSRTYTDSIPRYMDGVNILCFLGTWCSDSRREVPRMLKLIQTRNLPPETMTMIGLDREKHSGTGEEKKYDIEKVPTFIVLRNGEEIGRIVEKPIGPIEKDLLGILNPQPIPQQPEGVDASGDAAPAHNEEEQRRMMEQKRPVPPPQDGAAPR